MHPNNRLLRFPAVAAAFLWLSGPAPLAAGDSPLMLQGKGFRVVVQGPLKGLRIEDAAGGPAWKLGAFKARRRSPKGGWEPLAGLQPRRGKTPGGPAIRCEGKTATVLLTLEDAGTSLGITVTSSKGGTEGPNILEEVQILPELRIPGNAPGSGSVIVPVREGLWIPAGEGPAFQRAFPTSDYEGCHLNMLGLLAAGQAAVVSWNDAYTTPVISRTVEGADRVLRLEIRGRRTARKVKFTPLGKGGIDEVAAAYRAIAKRKGLRVTLREKMASRPALERLLGASNFKLWTCLRRKMSEDSKREESVTVNWTFEQAAQIAEHLRRDLDIDRSIFTLGGWIHRGYDCQHPDILPAAPECGGNEALAAALKRIRALGYADCLHDNYQDIYRDSPSWSEDLIMKRPGGKLAAGGRWLGGRAYLVCAPKSLELARRPQNLPEVRRLFAPLTYFIDTTFAVGPQECFDPKHPLTRNDDIWWKSKLSDYARQVFGVFGSECGREWAIPHSDFFEGLVGVGGRYYHNLKPEALGATVIPFFEMVYHDCEAAWGKYGYNRDAADEYVLHHIACARPLHHHNIPPGLYWKTRGKTAPGGGVFTRADNGWAEGFCVTDRFLKNTHEVCGPLNLLTAHDVLRKLEFLDAKRSVRRFVYGLGKDAVYITCNFGKQDAVVKSRRGGEVTLPRYGFLVESKGFLAFHATRWAGADLEGGALFTLRSLDGRPLETSRRVRVFHGFGPSKMTLRGKPLEVKRERVIRSGPTLEGSTASGEAARPLAGLILTRNAWPLY